MSHSQSNIPYQPTPFCVRRDCEERFNAIKEFIPRINNSTVLDFGCAEGYMGFRFLQEHAKSVLFVDNDSDCISLIKERADMYFSKKKHPNKIKTNIFLPDGLNFDISL